MKLRSYHTETVEAAIRMAAIELGDEAIFLGSKRGPDNGPYEVTFALVEGEPKPDSPAEVRPGARSGSGAVSEEVVKPATSRKGARVNGKGAAGRESTAGPKQKQGSAAAPADHGPVHWRQFVPPPEDVESDTAAAGEVPPDSSTTQTEQRATFSGSSENAKSVQLAGEQPSAPRNAQTPEDAPSGEYSSGITPYREPLPAAAHARRRLSTQERFQLEERLAESIAELTHSLRDVRGWLLRQQGPNGTLPLADNLPLADKLLADGLASSQVPVEGGHRSPSPGSAESSSDPLRAALYARLIEQGVEVPLIAQILTTAGSTVEGLPDRDSPSTPTEDAGENAAQALLEERLAFLCDGAGLSGKRGGMFRPLRWSVRPGPARLPPWPSSPSVTG